MRRKLFLLLAGGILAAAGGLFILQRAESRPGAAQFREVSPEAADALGAKIERIRGVEASTTRRPAEASLVASDIEMESFVLFWMKDEIPARVDSIDVVIGDGTISAATDLTFESDSTTGNPVVDVLLKGSHSLFVEGRLEGRDGRGMFELQAVRVDGFPVPLVVIDVLVEQYVNPRYPHVDLDEPFAIPWGIEEIALSPGRATIRY